MRTKEYVLRDDYERVIIKSYHSVLAPQTRPLREHHHTECELSIFLAGAGTYAVGEREYHFEAGDVFLFGSNEAHCITKITEQMDLLNVHFEAKLLWERPESTELLNLFAARSKSFSHQFPHGDPKLKQYVLDLCNELQTDQPCRLLSSKCALFAVLVHMVRSYDCINPERVINAPSSVTKSLKKAIYYIIENLQSKLTLDEIAAVACMTPTYFSSVFKKFNGVSPWEFITIKRVEKAIEMLKTSSLSKLEIAERCGFSSSSNFYKAFLHITGKKPGDFVTK